MINFLQVQYLKLNIEKHDGHPIAICFEIGNLEALFCKKT
jgi:hypothetical protein